MACRVDLIYNPFSQAARLEIDRQEFERQGSKMQKMVVGKPMGDWLEAVTRGYLQWNGFLQELIEEINEVKVEIVFTGRKEDYNRFSEAVHRQAAALPDSGFEPVEIGLTLVEQYSANHLISQMRAMRKNWEVPVPTQKLLLARDRLDSRLESDLSLEETIRLINDYVGLIRQMQRDTEAQYKTKTNEMRRTWESLLGQEGR